MNRSLIFRALLLFAFGLAFVGSVASEDNSPSLNDNSNIIQGDRRPRSVRVHSALTTGSTFRWSGENFISRIEVVRQSASTAPIRVTGGLFTYGLQLETTNGAPLDARVNIFSEPEPDRVLGIPVAESKLVNTQRVRGRGRASMTYRGAGTITHVQLLDQTNGTGTFVQDYRGILRQEFFIQFGVNQFNGVIDYIVNVYAGPFVPI